MFRFLVCFHSCNFDISNHKDVCSGYDEQNNQYFGIHIVSTARVCLSYVFLRFVIFFFQFWLFFPEYDLHGPCKRINSFYMQTYANHEPRRLTWSSLCPCKSSKRRIMLISPISSSLNYLPTMNNMTLHEPISTFNTWK